MGLWTYTCPWVGPNPKQKQQVLPWIGLILSMRARYTTSTAEKHQFWAHRKMIRNIDVDTNTVIDTVIVIQYCTGTDNDNINIRNIRYQGYTYTYTREFISFLTCIRVDLDLDKIWLKLKSKLKTL